MTRTSGLQKRTIAGFRILLLLALSVLPAAAQQVSNSQQADESSIAAIDLKRGLVAYYPFDGNPEDQSGHENHGTPHGVVEYGEGMIGQAVQFLGDEDRGFVTVKHSESLTFDDAMTVACWFRIDDDAGQTGENASIGRIARAHQVLVAKHGDIVGFSMLSLAETSSQRLIAIIGQNHSPAEFGIAFPPDEAVGQWHHSAAVADADGVRLYLNGTLVGSTRSRLHLENVNNYDVFIGINGPAGGPSDPDGFLWFPLNGAIDEVRFYNRAISQQEVQSLAGLDPAKQEIVSPGHADELPAFGPEQATGLPDTPNRHEDAWTAWASETADGQPEWLILEFARSVRPKALLIYEASNCGAVHQVSVFDADGGESTVWEGNTRRRPNRNAALPSVVFFETPFQTDRVKLYLDSMEIPGWNQIDAVGLRDVSGNVQWAVKATASSTKATDQKGRSLDIDGAVRDFSE